MNRKLEKSDFYSNPGNLVASFLLGTIDVEPSESNLGVDTDRLL